MGGGLTKSNSDYIDLEVTAAFLDFEDPAKLALLTKEELNANIDASAKSDELMDIANKLKNRGLGMSPDDLKHDATTQGEFESEVRVRQGDFKYKNYWGVLKGTRVFLYKKRTSKKPSRILWVSFWEKEEFDKDMVAAFGEDHPDNYQELEAYMADGSVYRCFTTDGLFSIKFDTEENGSKWDELILSVLKANFIEEELVEKQDLCKVFQMRMFEQTCLQLLGRRLLMSNIEAAGFADFSADLVHPMADPKKIKFGYLKMLMGDEDEEGIWKEEWRKFYFVLLPGHMYAYAKSRDEHPSGHLSMGKIGVERSPSSPNILIITTPLRSFSIKFQNQFSLFDWLHALMTSSTQSNCGILLQEMHTELNSTLLSLMSSKPPIPKTSMTLNLHLLSDVDYRSKPSKSRIFPLKPTTIIGRESSCTITVDDANASRAHCKIDVDDNGGCRVTDLGSGNGTRVNGEYVEPHVALTGGDILVVGKSTVFTVGGDGDTEKVEQWIKKRREEVEAKKEKSKRSEIV